MSNDTDSGFVSDEDLGFVSDEALGFVSDLPPTPLPQRVLRNIGSTASSIAAPLVSGGDSLLSNLTEAGVDTARGVSQGFLMGAGDEIGGAIMSPIEALYNRFNPTDVALREKGFDIPQPGIADLYRQNQQAIQKELEVSQDRSPWLYTGGQIGGGIASGSAIGGALGIGKALPGAPKLMDIARNQGKMKALGTLLGRGGKTYAQALPVIAAESALSSKEGGIFNEQERSKLLEDTVGGALFGLPVVMGLQGATDVVGPMLSKTAGKMKEGFKDLVTDTPLLRQMKVSYGYGKEGINPKSQAVILDTDLGGASNLTQLDNQRSVDLMNEIYSAEQKVGKTVGDSLQKATIAGKLVDVSEDTKSIIAQIQSLATKYPEITNNPRAAQVFEKISGGQAQITPLEAKDLIDYMDAYIGKFKASTNTTPAEQGILSSLYSARKQFSNTLKDAIPEYRQAAERYAQFETLVPETILAGNRPVGIKEEFFGGIKNQDQRLFDQIKKLNQGTTRQGSATQPIRESFVNTIKGMKTFEAQDAERLTKGQISDSAFARPIKDIEKQIKQHSDDAVARGAMDALEPHTGVSTTLARAITGTGETGRAMSLSAANVAGRMSNRIGKSTILNPISKAIRSVYNAPKEVNLALAQRLKAVPGLSKYGQSLEEALNSPDQTRRNAVLFTIMQNPSARWLVNEEPQE